MKKLTNLSLPDLLEDSGLLSVEERFAHIQGHGDHTTDASRDGSGEEVNPGVVRLVRIEEVLADPVRGEHGGLEGHVHAQGGEVGAVEGPETLGVVDVPRGLSAGGIGRAAHLHSLFDD